VGGKAVSLIVENGTIVDNADSFVTRSEFIGYAASIGVTLPDTAATDQRLRAAAMYLRSLEGRLKGERVERDQPLPYPRKNLVLEGFAWEDDEIPRQVILAQMALALDLHAGIDLYNRPQNQPITQERVEGAVSVSYAAPNVVSKVSTESSATALVNVLLKRAGLLSIPLERV